MNDTDNRFANLSDVEFKNAATYAAMMIERHGFVYVTLSPGDGTRYEISLASPPTGYQHDRYKFWTRDGETQPLTFQPSRMKRSDSSWQMSLLAPRIVTFMASPSLA